jgi:hypothetical protein
MPVDASGMGDSSMASASLDISDSTMEPVIIAPSPPQDPGPQGPPSSRPPRARPSPPSAATADDPARSAPSLPRHFQMPPDTPSPRRSVEPEQGVPSLSTPATPAVIHMPDQDEVVTEDEEETSQDRSRSRCREPPVLPIASPERTPSAKRGSEQPCSGAEVPESPHRFL